LGGRSVRDGLLRLEYELQRVSGLMSRRMQSVQGWESWDLKHIVPNTSPEIFSAVVVRAATLFSRQLRDLARN
jgi:hypothetical protein